MFFNFVSAGALLLTLLTEDKVTPYSSLCTIYLQGSIPRRASATNANASAVRLVVLGSGPRALHTACVPSHLSAKERLRQLVLASVTLQRPRRCQM